MIKKRKCFHLLLFFILFATFFYTGNSAQAENLVSDSAGLLSSEEKSQIQTLCDQIQTLYDTSVFIITSDKMGKSDDYETYMEKQRNKQEATQNLIVLFISTKENQHVYQIHGYGFAEKMLTHDRLNAIMDDMQGDLSDGDYYEALRTFCNETLKYLEKDPRFDSIIFQSIPQLILAFIISAIIIFLLLYNRIGKNTTTAFTYLLPENSKILGHMEHFSHMTVTRVPINKNDNNSGSDSGSSHSSGDAHTF